MNRLSSFALYAVIVQGFLLVVLAILFYLVLPGMGITRLGDLNNQTKFAAAESVLYAVNWIHVMFALTTAVTALALYVQLKNRIPLLVRFILAIILAWAVIFFVGHDLGFGIYLWDEIVADPAATVISMDMALLNFRNVVFFVVGLLTVVDGWHSPSKQPLSPATK